MPPQAGVIGWSVADAWEEVPKYQRIDVLVNSMAGPVDAQTYICSDDSGATPVDDDRFALLSDLEVQASISLFEPVMRRLRDRAGDV